MSINTQKFLPSPKTSLIKIKSSKGTKVSSLGILKDIETKVISIDSFLKKSLVVKKDQIKKEKTITEKQKFRNIEKELEKKVPVKKVPGINLPKPKLGIFDWIKNFATNVLLGFVLIRVIDYLPKLLTLVPLINSAMDFVIGWGGKLLEGLVNFVDFGYKAVDATRGFVSGIFGEDGVKKFDEFSTKFRDLVNYSLIAAMLIGDIGDDIIGGPGGGRGGYRNSYGGGKRGLDGDFRRETLEGGLKKAENGIMKRYFQRYGRDAFVERFGQEGLKRLPGGMQRGLLQRGARSAFIRLLGKGGAKTVLKFIRPFTERLPIIGAFLDFALSIALGESIGRAAFRAIGAGVLGAIGTAAGSIVPFAGNLIGGIAGSALGDWAGGALYDLFFENKKAKNNEPQNVYKHAEGGSVRGGTYTGGPARRGIKKAKTSRTLKIAPTPLTPGRSVGGNVKDTKLDKTKIELFYPKGTNIKEVKPYEFVEKSYKASSKTSFIGSLFGLAIKTIFGDKPTPIDYQNISSGINSWINVIIDNVRTGYRAFAGGGLALSETEERDLRNWLNIVIQNSVNPRVNQILQELMRQLTLKPLSGPKGPNPAPPGESQKSDPNTQFQGKADFVIGDSIAHGFAGRSGNGSDADDSKVGRKPAEVLAILKSKGEALRGKLIDLSTGIANSKEDWSIVEEQLKYLQSMGAKVRLLGVGKQWDQKSGGNQVNAKLQQLAGQYGAYFYGGHNASGDKDLGVHGSPQDYEELRHKLASTAVSGNTTGGNLVEVGKSLLQQGFTVGENKYFKNNAWSAGPPNTGMGFDPSGSQPSHGHANDADHRTHSLDVTWHRGPAYGPEEVSKLTNLFKDLYQKKDTLGLTDLIYDKYGYWFKGSNFVPRPYGGHDNHLHIRFQGAAFGGQYITGFKPKIFKTHKGEYIIDKDSVDAFGLPFIYLINKIENQQQLKGNIDKLMKMLDYEYEGSQIYIIEEDDDDEYYAQPTVEYIGLGNMPIPPNKDNSWHYDILNA